MDRHFLLVLFSLPVLGWAAGPVPADWKNSRDVQVSANGVVRVPLPLDALSGVQPSLADLRLVDPAAQETAYLLDRPDPEPAVELPLASMTMALEKGKTVVTGMVPGELKTRGFDQLILYSPSDDFLKAVTLEGSQDGKHWSMLAHQYPIFKEPSAPMSTTLPFTRGNWAWLRLSIDDRSTPPIRIQGVRLFARSRPLSDLEQAEAQIQGMASDGHQTAVELTLPGDNLAIHAIRIEAPETTFRRPVTVAVPQLVSGEVRDQFIGQGLVYRANLGRETAESLEVPIHRVVPGRSLRLRLENGDSRPLAIQRITVVVVPTYLVFDAPAPGTYSLWSGNLAAPARTYDIAGLKQELRKGAGQRAQFAAPLENTQWQAPEALPQAAEEGADIDVSHWQYRKKVAFGTASGSDPRSRIWRLELDLESIAHNKNRAAAVRLVRNGKQLPYIWDNAGVGREFEPKLQAMPATKEAPTRSQWVLQLPYGGIPFNQLSFTLSEPLFQRQITAYEETLDERGEPVRRAIGQAQWTRTHGDQKEAFLLSLYSFPSADRLVLETDNGDNAPIHITAVKGYYLAPRLLFKATPVAGQDVELYYGQNDIAAPQYDLSLIAGELQTIAPQEAALGKEEALHPSDWWQAPIPQGKVKYVFWGVMALVVLGLLGVIAKLLPAETAEKKA